MSPLDSQITKSAVLLEALPYMQSFRGCTFLIKVGGSAMEDPVQVDSFLRDVVFLEAVGINPVIVHGGGKAISKAMNESGLQARFINGMRVTDDETIKIVEETLARIINPAIVDKINAFGGKAVGIPGTEVFTGQKLSHDLGWVGEVTDCKTGLIQAAVAGEFVPVVSPVAREIGEMGSVCNILTWEMGSVCNILTQQSFNFGQTFFVVNSRTALVLPFCLDGLFAAMV